MKWRRHQHYPLTALAAPMAVWALHFVGAYSLVGLGCVHAWHLRQVGALSLLTWMLVALTAVALGLIAWLGWRAWRRWQALGAGPGAASTQHRERFLRLATALLAMLAFIAVWFTAIPIFMLPPCT